MAEDKIAPKFRKTKNDKWAVMAPVADLEKALAGDGKIEVLKKSGDWSSFTVISLGKPFDVDGVSMCYGYSEEQESSTGSTDKSESGQNSSAPAEPSNAALAAAPSFDPSEPLPEFQGGPEDEWAEF